MGAPYLAASVCMYTCMCVMYHEMDGGHVHWPTSGQDDVIPLTLSKGDSNIQTRLSSILYEYTYGHIL
jgi:hypothetical protein